MTMHDLFGGVDDPITEAARMLNSSFPKATRQPLKLIPGTLFPGTQKSTRSAVQGWTVRK